MKGCPGDLRSLLAEAKLIELRAFLPSFILRM